MTTMGTRVNTKGDTRMFTNESETYEKKKERAVVLS